MSLSDFDRFPSAAGRGKRGQDAIKVSLAHTWPPLHTHPHRFSFLGFENIEAGVMLHRHFLLALGLFAASACSADTNEVAESTAAAASTKPPKKLVVNDETRRAMVAEGSVLDPTIGNLQDPYAGPQDGPSHPWKAVETCSFVEPDDAFVLRGWTRKFECRLANGSKVKVKYDRGNPEVYTEVFVSRLLWTLGIAADRYYPVVIDCPNCPSDPYAYLQAVSQAATAAEKEALRRSTSKGPTRFDPAIIEYKFGTEVETTEGREGWGFETELLQSFSADPERARAQRIEREGLTLLMAALMHVDNRPANQRIACAPGKVLQDATGAATCAPEDALLYVQDLGATLGLFHISQDRRIPPRVGFELWRFQPVWAPFSACSATVTTTSGEPTLKNAVLHEEGRAWIHDKLKGLSLEQVETLFKVARIEELGGPPASEWARVFFYKVREMGKPCRL
jgi:hypothetical protein